MGRTSILKWYRRRNEQTAEEKTFQFWYRVSINMFFSSFSSSLVRTVLYFYTHRDDVLFVSTHARESFCSCCSPKMNRTFDNKLSIKNCCLLFIFASLLTITDSKCTGILIVIPKALTVLFSIRSIVDQYYCFFFLKSFDWNERKTNSIIALQRRQFARLRNGKMFYFFGPSTFSFFWWKNWFFLLPFRHIYEWLNKKQTKKFWMKFSVFVVA